MSCLTPDPHAEVEECWYNGRKVLTAESETPEERFLGRSKQNSEKSDGRVIRIEGACDRSTNGLKLSGIWQGVGDAEKPSTCLC
jgi:hypothetical protein